MTDSADRSAEMLSLVLPIWRDALARPELTADDDFFAAGGHSMLALRILFDLQDRLQAEIPIELIFEHPTARTFASGLERELARAAA